MFHKLLSGLLVFSADSLSFSIHTVGRERDLTIADGDIRIADDALGLGVRPEPLASVVGRLPEATGG